MSSAEEEPVPKGMNVSVKSMNTAQKRGNFLVVTEDTKKRGNDGDMVDVKGPSSKAASKIQEYLEENRDAILSTTYHVMGPRELVGDAIAQALLKDEASKNEDYDEDAAFKRIAKRLKADLKKNSFTHSNIGSREGQKYIKQQKNLAASSRKEKADEAILPFTVTDLPAFAKLVGAVEATTKSKSPGRKGGKRGGKAKKSLFSKVNGMKSTQFLRYNPGKAASVAPMPKKESRDYVTVKVGKGHVGFKSSDDVAAFADEYGDKDFDTDAVTRQVKKGLKAKLAKKSTGRKGGKASKKRAGSGKRIRLDLEASESDMPSGRPSSGRPSSGRQSSSRKSSSRTSRKSVSVQDESSSDSSIDSDEDGSIGGVDSESSLSTE